MPGLLILNADDFGASSAVNEAVIRARRAGALTSASLMVFGAASDDAAVIAREERELAVGLHIVVSDLPDPVRAGFALSFSRAARAKARASIARQFDVFVDMGLELSHVDGHQHLHAHPAVLPLIVQLAEHYGARGIRVPREPVGFSIGEAYLRRSCRRWLRGSRLATCHRCIGRRMSGRMSADYVIRALSALPSSSVEVYFHPSLERTDRLGSNPGDLQALTDPALADYIRDSGWGMTNYAGLRAAREVETSERH